MRKELKHIIREEVKNLNESINIETFPVGGDKFNVGYTRQLNDWGKYVKDQNNYPAFQPGIATHVSDYKRGDAAHRARGGHFGIDIFAPKGAPVIAPVSGMAYTDSSKIGGIAIKVEKDGKVYFHGHCESSTIGGTRKNPVKVSAGQQIGTVGDSGNARGKLHHVHFNVYTKSGGFRKGSIDPGPEVVAMANKVHKSGPIEVNTDVDYAEADRGGWLSKAVAAALGGIVANFGDRNKSVEEMQLRLMHLGYSVGSPKDDGIFGPFTQQGLKDFQEAENIPVTGVYNKATHAKLKKLTKDFDPKTDTYTDADEPDIEKIKRQKNLEKMKKARKNEVFDIHNKVHLKILKEEIYRAKKIIKQHTK
jgi:hypothetical protein